MQDTQTMSRFSYGSVAIAAILLTTLTPAPAQACGGFFCSAAAPVNQAAERIVFAQNGDGTVSAVVQIQYSGPSESFAWVLPVPGIPDVAVSSDLAFTRLQTASNPQYLLTVDIEGRCREPRNSPQFDCGAAGGGADGGTGAPEVLASGTVGPYDFVVLEIDGELDQAGDVAVEWLVDEGYDVVPPGGDPADISALLGSYLEGGMNLLAFRLTKGNDTGSIRPIWITYESDRPMIPIRPTAVAANDDMGVMVWVLGQNRAVPINYKSLELDEALIDWTTGGLFNYNQVVVTAANEAGGQGFVTERAGPSSDYANVVFSNIDDQSWRSLQQQSSARSPEAVFIDSAFSFGQWDGYRDVVKPLLPEAVDVDDFIACPGCYTGQLPGVSVGALLSGLNISVIHPMRETQELLESLPYVTRLYTTLSAPEMDLDPEFDFNPDLQPVSNIHNARQVIECAGNLFVSEAPWRVELEDGRVIRGQGGWPFVPGAPGSLPANARVLQLTTSGAGTVITDNSETIDALLDAHNATIPGPRGSDGCTLRAGGASDLVIVTLAAVGIALAARRRKSARRRS